MGFWFFGRKKEGEPEYIDEKLLDELREVKDAVRLRKKKISKIERAFLKCQVEFSKGIKKGKIKNKDPINASIQLIVKLIGEAKEELGASKNQKLQEKFA